MRAILLALLLAGSPEPAAKPAPKPRATAARAHALAKRADWDSLYLAFAAADPEGYSAPARARIAADLFAGCRALRGKDPVMAYSLASRAVLFRKTAEDLECLADTAWKAQMRDDAEKALRTGMKLFPRDGRFPLALAQRLLADADPKGALESLRHLPAGRKWQARARPLRAQARAAIAQRSKALQKLDALQAKLNRAERNAARAEPSDTPGAEADSALSSVTADGMRTRADGDFIIKYFGHDRDFAQRARFEGRAVAALRDIGRFDRNLLHVHLNHPVQVLLYTRAEYATFVGPVMGQISAGVFSNGSIRLNGSARMDQNDRATLAHEYTHAVVDDLCNHREDLIPLWLNEGLAQWVEWQYLGWDGPRFPVRVGLRREAESHRLPPLTDFVHHAPIADPHPGLRYGQSATAVQLLIQRRGLPAVLDLIRTTGAMGHFEKQLQAGFGWSMADLQDALLDTLSHY